MKTADFGLVEQRLVQGQYERAVTNTAHLASELSAPQDLGLVIANFDRGLTSVRSVGRMITAQRGAILTAYEDGTITDVASNYPEVLSSPVANLHARVVEDRGDQPVGHNFFVNATGFLDANMSWAQQLDATLQQRTGATIYDIARSHDLRGKDRLLEALTDNPDSQLTTSLAVYLAGRSLEGERYLEQQYGNVLHRTKSQIFESLGKIATTTGLRIDMLERAAGQLQRTRFGSFDHLQRLVTSENSGSAGDYVSESLRIEVHFTGSVATARPRSEAQAHGVIAHELGHAASAQAGDRVGLQADSEGLQANEGMTEYLAQLAIGSPGIQRLARDNLVVSETVAYQAPVAAMLALHAQFAYGKNQHFATLFNAYQGDVRSSAQLEQALDAFYQQDAAITRQLAIR